MILLLVMLIVLGVLILVLYLISGWAAWFELLFNCCLCLVWLLYCCSCDIGVVVGCFIIGGIAMNCGGLICLLGGLFSCFDVGWVLRCGVCGRWRPAAACV